MGSDSRPTTDDILDSLTRQAELRQKLRKQAPVRLEEIAETAELNQLGAFNTEPASKLGAADKRSFGHIAFALILLVGLTVVGLYSLISKPFNLTSLNAIIQKSGLQSIFRNQVQFGIIGLAALLGALWIRRRRRVQSLIISG